MPDNATDINLKLTTIPLMNLRYEFIKYYDLLQDENFQNQFGQGRRVIVAPPFQWHGFQNELLTWILQKAILSLESYVCTAASLASMSTGKRSPEVVQGIENPFRLGKNGTADNFYNKLPGLIDPEIRLSNYDSELFKKVKAFYRDVRNPLFHGKQLADDNPKSLIPTFELLKSVFDWIEWWTVPVLKSILPK